jgi:hypothetical protein
MIKKNLLIFYLTKIKMNLILRAHHIVDRPLIKILLETGGTIKFYKLIVKLVQFQEVLKIKIVTFVAKEKIIQYGQTYEVDHFHLKSKDMSLPKTND